MQTKRRKNARICDYFNMNYEHCLIAIVIWSHFRLRRRAFFQKQTKAKWAASKTTKIFDLQFYFQYEFYKKCSFRQNNSCLEYTCVINFRESKKAIIIKIVINLIKSNRKILSNLGEPVIGIHPHL